MVIRLRLTDYQLAVVEAMRGTLGATLAAVAIEAIAHECARLDDPLWQRHRRRPPQPALAPRDTRLDKVLPAASAVALRMTPGQRLRIQQLKDGQCVDLQVFEPGGRGFSAARTRALHGMSPSVGAALWSTVPEVILMSITSDTAPPHDLTFPPCSEGEYTRFAGIGGHLGCAELHAAQQTLHRAGADGGSDDVLNLWLPSAASADGSLRSWPARCRRGDHVELRAERDVVVTLSTCPDDVFGSSQYEPGSVRVLVGGGPSSPVVTSRWPAQPPASALARQEISVEVDRAGVDEIDRLARLGWLGTGRSAVLRALIFRLHEALANTATGAEAMAGDTRVAPAAHGH